MSGLQTSTNSTGTLSHGNSEFSLDNLFTPLIRAILASDLPGIEALLLGGADINEPDDLGELPIFYAIAAGKPSLPALLKHPGLQINKKNSVGDTPLIAATKTTQIDLVTELLHHRGNPHQRDAQGYMALDYAMHAQDPKMIALLLTHMGYTPQDQISSSTQPDRLRAIVENILAQGHCAFFSAQTEQGRIQHKLVLRKELFDTLNEQDKRVYLQNRQHITLIIGQYKQTAMTHFLQMTQTKRFDFQLLTRGLHSALPPSKIIMDLRRFFIRELLWQGSERNITTFIREQLPTLSTDSTLFHLAYLDFEIASLDTWTPAEMLPYMQHIAPDILTVNDQNMHGYTALMVAIQERHKPTIQYILSVQTLNINLQATCGLTALIAAVQMNDVEIVEQILTTQRGKINFLLQTTQGYSALDFAQYHALTSDDPRSALRILLLLLRESGLLLPEMMIPAEETLFTLVAKLGELEIMGELLRYSANPAHQCNIPNMTGQTALSIALEAHNLDMANLLPMPSDIFVSTDAQNTAQDLFHQLQDEFAQYPATDEGQVPIDNTPILRSDIRQAFADLLLELNKPIDEIPELSGNIPLESLISAARPISVSASYPQTETAPTSNLPANRLKTW